jgi:hypothetical protein
MNVITKLKSWLVQAFGAGADTVYAQSPDASPTDGHVAVFDGTTGKLRDGGVIAVKLDGVAWFTSSGSSAGDGSPSNPYGSNCGQIALNAGYRSFIIAGSGLDIGDLDFTGMGAIYLEVLSFGTPLTPSAIGNLTRSDNGDIYLNITGFVSIASAAPAAVNDSSGSSIVIAGLTYVPNFDAVTIGSITTNAGPVSSGGGQNGGSVVLKNVFCSGTITSNGSDGFDDGMGTPQNGGNGGTIVVPFDSPPTFVNNAGNPVNGGSSGTSPAPLWNTTEALSNSFNQSIDPSATVDLLIPWPSGFMPYGGNFTAPIFSTAQPAELVLAGFRSSGSGIVISVRNTDTGSAHTFNATISTRVIPADY